MTTDRVIPNPLTTPIDGLTDEEYRQRYGLATQNRALKNKHDPAEMLSIILDLLSRPRSDTLNETYMKAVDEEAQRDYFDLGDWIKFLHEQFYKPGWKVELLPQHNPWPTIAMELTAVVEIPTHEKAFAPVKKKLGLRYDVHPQWCRTTDDADRILTGMIEDCERKIMLAWRRKTDG